MIQVLGEKEGTKEDKEEATKVEVVNQEIRLKIKLMSSQVTLHKEEVIIEEEEILVALKEEGE